MNDKKGEKIIKGISVFKTFMEGFWIFLKIVAVVIFVLFIIYVLKLIPEMIPSFEEVALYGN
ncbi:MAG: hypothetical protein PHT30_02325 [Bacilli bacterium]|nr:hypothetical protein [Bacilli bacterium]